jgi:SH3 domain protein
LRISLVLMLFTVLYCGASQAADIRFVGGEHSVSLRGGAGTDYPIVYRGIEPGTRVTVIRTSDNGQWADITADNDIIGWIATDKLVLEAPLLAAGAEDAAVTDGTAIAPAGELDGDAEQEELPGSMYDCDAEFNQVAQELHHLKRVSGKAVQLDIDNRRLVEERENLRSDVEMLQAENLRLLEKIRSEDFMNGALAVLLGVIIALVAPRLVPKRRKTSSW